MTFEAAVIIAVVLLSLFVIVAVVTLADFDLYKAFLKKVLIQKNHRDLHPLPPKMSIVG